MQKLLLLAALTACLVTGCDGGNHATFDVNGTIVTIIRPVNSTIEATALTLGGEMGNATGRRITSTTTDKSGVKVECVVEITNSQLTMNGKKYGSVAKGDTVEIDGATIKVNDAQRAISR